MGSCEIPDSYDVSHNGLYSSRHLSFQPSSKLSASWFELRVFYVRISNYAADNSTPESLTVNHLPLNPDTLLEVNGVRCSIYSDGISSILRRDRVDKNTEEATFVSTDSVRFTGSVKFEVFDKDDLFLTGFLKMPSSNGCTEEAMEEVKNWSLDCNLEMATGTGFLKVKRNGRSEYAKPITEVYVAGWFSGAPIMLTKTLQLPSRKKNNKILTLDAIPEHETNSNQNDVKSQKDVTFETNLQVAEYRGNKPEIDFSSPYWRISNYMEGEDGELSWFNAGVRVGVGIGLGVCVGVGVGVGLLVRTYQATTRGFRRRLFYQSLPQFAFTASFFFLFLFFFFLFLYNEFCCRSVLFTNHHVKTQSNGK
ncbi:hypothetical protein RND81_03G033200 [Saponaria officinalis]|uniref:Erythronate-4-phosphate dehydrogenase family protein n=1 Tax=Saponaria officinalis TaxID=3572 RepID=A0AAW1M456_SAPOF